MNQNGSLQQLPCRMFASPKNGVPVSDAPARLDELMQAALDSAPAGMMVLYPDLTVRHVTSRAASMLGLPSGNHARLPVMQLLAGCRMIDSHALMLLTAALDDAGPDPLDVLLTLRSADTTRRIAVDIRAAAGVGWIISFSDVTSSHDAQDWLLEHVSSDPVTGLWNRQHLTLMLQDRLTHKQAGELEPAPAMLLIGLHRFSVVTETLGLGGGDMLLRMAGVRLSALLAPDDMLAQFARDEFAVILARPGDRTGLERFAATVCDTLGKPYAIEGQRVSCSVHVGVAVAPDDGDTADTLIANAVLALLAARAAPACPVNFFDASLIECARERHALEADFRHALTRHEFELHYQPQVEVWGGRVTGLEALIRWRNPRLGMVPPVVFIPLAEQNGLIVEIGDWVLREACSKAAAWPGDVTIAVNASPLQFETGHFAQTVAEALAQSGLPAWRLEIEITESLLLRDTGAVLETLAALRKQGVRLVLDDFGTGYASLSQLSRFRFDKIKIDRSFVSIGAASQENNAIVRAIAALGRSLGVPTTAEGVETATQLALVRAEGCTSVQGYFYSRPVPLAEVDQMLQRIDSMRTSPQP